MKKNIICDKSFHFSLEVIQLYKNLTKSKEFILSNQLLRSGTSVGANIHEAINGESRKDFIHKMSISLKEAHETEYWLKLLDKSNLVDLSHDKYISEIHEIISILIKIIKTTKSNVEIKADN